MGINHSVVFQRSRLREPGCSSVNDWTWKRRTFRLHLREKMMQIIRRRRHPVRMHIQGTILKTREADQVRMTGKRKDPNLKNHHVQHSLLWRGQLRLRQSMIPKRISKMNWMMHNTNWWNDVEGRRRRRTRRTTRSRMGKRMVIKRRRRGWERRVGNSLRRRRRGRRSGRRTRWRMRRNERCRW